ncbi:MAG: glutamate racemase [Chthoniobacterales bacterium]
MANEMDSARRPIGVFDSGIGGLTVVAAMRKVLPNESIIYVGDTARVPYGGKSASTVQRYSTEIAEMLLAENAKIIVVACNTASALAVPLLHERLSVPLTGVILPGAKAAVAATRNGRIGVIGTRATVQSGAYEKAIRALQPNLQIFSCACPLLVPLIEEGWRGSPITDQVIMKYLAGLLKDGIDTLVLGCTHYPLLRDDIARLIGAEVTLVDSAENCATAVRELLQSENLAAASASNGTLRICLTDPPDSFLEVAAQTLGLEVGEVELRQLC